MFRAQRLIALISASSDIYDFTFCARGKKNIEMNVVVSLCQCLNGQLLPVLHNKQYLYLAIRSPSIDGFQTCYPKLSQHISSHADEPQRDVYKPNLDIKDAHLAHKPWANKTIKWQPHPHIKQGTMPCNPNLFLA